MAKNTIKDGELTGNEVPETNVTEEVKTVEQVNKTVRTITVINGNSYPVNILLKGKIKVLSSREQVQDLESNISFTDKSGLRIF